MKIINKIASALLVGITGITISSCSDVSAKLPEGFPPPTKEGVVEIKTYPIYRAAGVKIKGNNEKSASKAFKPLFNHIKDNKISMTAPVEVDFNKLNSEKEEEAEVYFLYESTNIGKTGDTKNDVKVVDKKKQMYISIGVKGPYNMETMNKALPKLYNWLDNNKEKYASIGKPRRLFYNDPFRLPNLLVSDVQIPIKKIKE